MEKSIAPYKPAPVAKIVIVASLLLGVFCAALVGALFFLFVAELMKENGYASGAGVTTFAPIAGLFVTVAASSYFGQKSLFLLRNRPQNAWAISIICFILLAVILVCAAVSAGINIFFSALVALGLAIGITYQFGIPKDPAELVIQDLFGDSEFAGFLRNTLDAWYEDKLASVSPGFRVNAMWNSWKGERGAKVPFRASFSPSFEKTFNKIFSTSQKRVFVDYLNLFPPVAGEFLVGIGDHWFVLTNKRLLQRNAGDDNLRELRLADIASTDFSKAKGTGIFSIKMKSSEEITFEGVGSYPNETWLNELIKLAQGN